MERSERGTIRESIDQALGLTGEWIGDNDSAGRSLNLARQWIVRARVAREVVVGSRIALQVGAGDDAGQDPLADQQLVERNLDTTELCWIVAASDRDPIAARVAGTNPDEMVALVGGDDEEGVRPVDPVRRQPGKELAEGLVVVAEILFVDRIAGPEPCVGLLMDGRDIGGRD